MPRFRTPLLATALALAAAPAYGDDAKDLKVAAKANELTKEYRIGPVAFLKDSVFVIRSAEELVARSEKPNQAKDPEAQKKAEAALAKLLKVEAIDWKKQMVVAGIVESFYSIKSDGKTVTVTYIRHVDRPVRAVLPKPKVVVLVERGEGEVRFRPKDPMLPKDEPIVEPKK